MKLRAGPGRRRFRFSLTRLGSPRVLRRGTRRGGPFRVRIPARARTGVYLVTARAGAGRAVWPVAVSRPARRGPLVVLPAIAWQALNPVDDDLDGFSDTLADSRSVPLGRPFSGSLPAGFRGQVAPLLRFLDARRLQYELTTDLDLDPRGHTGVALAGSERWLTGSAQRALRAYTQRGGRVASFGELPRREVEIRRGRLVDRGATAVLGRTGLVREPPAPLTVQKDELAIFGGQALIGEFSLFERASDRRADVLTSAGREGAPDFQAYRLGRGMVIRTGTPQWAARLGSDAGVAEATVRIWNLLRHG